MMSWERIFFALILLSSISVTPFSFAQVAPVAIFQSPEKQIEQGVSFDQIKCNDDRILMKKISDGSPACVKPQTAQKLVERGWGKIVASLIPSPIPTNCPCFYRLIQHTTGK